jgi:acyl-CoA oxidase
MLAYPESAGGADDMGAFVAVFETLAHHDLSLLVKFGVQFGLFGGSVQHLGTERHLDVLRRAGTAELLGCFAMTEIGHGSNVREIETTATYDAESREFVLHSPSETAGKNWAGNAARHATMATVFAQLHVGEEHHGVHAFLVPIRGDDGRALPGVRIADNGAKMGLEGVDNGRIWFERVRVPKDALLDRFARVSDDGEYESPIPSDTKRFFTMVGTLVGGRISVGTAGVSVAKSALAIAVKYAIRRRQFGQPGEPEMKIMDYQTHQTRLMPQLARTYALHFAMRDLLERYRTATAEGEDLQAVEARAAGLKAYATWHGRDTLQVCRECCGGEGYALVNRIGAFMNDFEIFTTFEGDNMVLVQLLTRGLLSGYRRQFTNMDFFGILRFAKDWAQQKVEGINPMSGRSTDAETLRSRDHHLHVLHVREQQLLSSVAARLKKRLDAGLEGVDALNQVQDHVVSTGLAHVERITYEAMCDGIDACEDEALRARLDLLRALYGVHCLMEHRAWFLENGYFQGTQSRAIRDEFLALCAQVREEASALVEAFAVPGAVLAAPIAVSPSGHS